MPVLVQELVQGSSAFAARPSAALFTDFCRDEILAGLPEGVRVPQRGTVTAIERLPAGGLTAGAGVRPTQSYATG